MAIPDDDPYPQDPYERHEGPIEPAATSDFNQWLLAVTLALIIAVAIAVGYTIHIQRASERLASANGRLAAQLSQAQNQVAGLTTKVNALSQPKPVQPAPPADETWTGKTMRPVATPAHLRRARTSSAASAWQRRMQAQLAEQRKRLADDEQTISKTQSDLSAETTSTQSSLTGLGGSIAKDHTELVALEKLGQRDYYEFDLSKSKKFAHEGPISLDLRHTDTKHQNYNVDLMVDDYKLSKKHVNLYEPVVLQTAENPQPLELVVNQITKNEIHGYISAPKTYEERASVEKPVQNSSADTPAGATPVQPQSEPLNSNGAATAPAVQPSAMTAETGTSSSPAAVRVASH